MKEPEADGRKSDVRVWIKFPAAQPKHVYYCSSFEPFKLDFSDCGGQATSVHVIIPESYYIILLYF